MALRRPQHNRATLEAWLRKYPKASKDQRQRWSESLAVLDLLGVDDPGEACKRLDDIERGSTAGDGSGDGPRSPAAVLWTQPEFIMNSRA